MKWFSICTNVRMSNKCHINKGVAFGLETQGNFDLLNNVDDSKGMMLSEISLVEKDKSFIVHTIFKVLKCMYITLNTFNYFYIIYIT